MFEARWRKLDDVWQCALHGRVLSLRQDSTHLHYQASFPDSTLQPPTPPSSTPGSTNDAFTEDDDTEALVHHYLNLEPNLTELYEQWSSVDANFKKKAPRFAGVRILRQDAWEALVGFICSSNNNIIRISQMVSSTELACPFEPIDHGTLQMEKLCVHYGPLVGYIGTTPYHDMPSPSVLANPKVEGHLRQLGFGYRAKYLYQTAVLISGKPEEGWLESLRNPESPVMGQKATSAGGMQPEGREGYRMAHEQLLALQGVGPKVADCVCLMGLGWGEAVPVDTHGTPDSYNARFRSIAERYLLVWQIAQRDYKFGRGKHNSLTKATYDAVGNRFRSLWGKEAGWAHSVLFTADLRAFSNRLSTNVEVTRVEEKNAGTKQEILLESELVTKKRAKEEPKDIDLGRADLATITEVTRIKRRKRM
ncbi:MAG: hypothetical protein LQ338_005698 [Usnochroma carphineum]|nr:MAG: hypothetical protein LQ338_005698 [Usnochroma carphineum]